MLRLIAINCSTYRQSSQTSSRLQHRDPENRLLARGPRLRLSAEMVRDQASGGLSGLLVRRNWVDLRSNRISRMGCGRIWRVSIMTRIMERVCIDEAFTRIGSGRLPLRR